MCVLHGLPSETWEKEGNIWVQEGERGEGKWRKLTGEKFRQGQKTEDENEWLSVA